MVIDFHTHIFPDSLAPRARQSLMDNTAKFGNFYEALTDMTRDSLIEHMDMWGIDISVIQPVVTKPSQTVTTNRWAADAAGDRIVAFGGIHPDTDDYKRDLDLVASLGLKGIKLHAEYQSFYPDEIRMLRIYDYAFSKGLIVLHHAGYDPGMPPPFHSTPERFEKMLNEVKGGTFVLAHLGGQQQWDDVEQYLVGRNVYFDTAMGFECFSPDQFLRIVKNHGADKILFGSDSPWSNASRELAVLRSLPIGENEREQILSLNAKRLLGI
ncbi:MAG: amidohydrolase [Clostridia bacterium]|nr:amidohydrolase [Clostridia bacterium]